MGGPIPRMDAKSPLLLHRTSQSDIRNGITVMVRGEGVQVYDQDGKAYLDLEAGVTRPVHVGYGREELARAAYDQMRELAYFTPMQFTNLPAMELAERLAGITPEGLAKFIFECDGSEAVETALKIARHYHYYQGDKGRFKVISRRGAYHGVNGLGVRALGTVLPMRQIMEPLAPGAAFIESPYCYRCPHHLTYPACDMACARELARIIEFEGPDQVSAFIGEPIQQGFGALRPPDEYWPVIREICNQYGVLLIIDEVICGFGRTGKMFATEYFDVLPDMLVMAKGITSGYLPLGAVGVRPEVMAPIETLNHLHTYGNHPVPCAVAIRNIDLLQKENLIANSAARGAYFLDGLRSLIHHPTVGEVRGDGLWLAIDFTLDKETREPYPGSSILSMISRAKTKGLIIKTMGSALEFAPPLIIKEADIDRAVAILDQCIAEEEQALGY